jgi:hypothetical protein
MGSSAKALAERQPRAPKKMGQEVSYLPHQIYQTYQP